jgi:dTDP-4-amino-4,6-dideoxygalactose transaminase
MDSLVRLSKSMVGEEEKAALSRVIDTGFLGMGREVQQFEEELSTFFGGRPVACVNSGTAALHVALASIGLQPGDEVLVQSLTFVATFQAISATGATPISCEVVPATVTIDLSDAERKITSATKAIVPVHYGSGVGALNEIYAFARKHRLRVIEDAAHAFGTVHEGKIVGSFGDVACFSFDGIKNITSGEGGAVVSDDREFMARVRDMRLLGVQKDSEKRFEGKRSWDFDVQHQGFRYHMSDLFAAIGRVQLGRFPEFKQRRIALALRYAEKLRTLPEFSLFEIAYGDVVPHIFPIRVLNSRRDSLRAHLKDFSIESGIHYLPNHLLSLYGGGENQLPVTEQVYSELLTLPLHAGLSDEEQTRVLDTIDAWTKTARGPVGANA